MKRRDDMVRCKVKLTPITVVHIGTGEELSPLNYSIDKDGVLYRFRTEKLIASFDNDKKKKLMDAIDKDDLQQVKNIISANVSKEVVDYSVPVTEKVKETYSSKLNNPENQLVISEMYRSKSTYIPIIPGSSLKGAIRTAFMSEIGLCLDSYSGKNDKNDFEKMVFKHSDPKNDPFRALCVSDCEILGKDSQMVSDFVNFMENRTENDDFSQMQLFSEIIKGLLCEGDSVGRFSININEDLLNITQNIKKGKQEWKHIYHKFTFRDIILACNNFYQNQFTEEFEKFYEETSCSELKNIAIKLNNYVADLKENECIIRVGKFSQVEAITVEKHRQPWNEKGYGATRTVTEDFYPAGWIKLSFEIKNENQKDLLLFSEENLKKLTNLFKKTENGKIEVGDVIEGTINGIKPFGAFVTLLGDKTGMVHVSEIADEFVKDINEYVKIGQKVKVKIKEIQENGKISLSMKNVS
jgi:CRISPR-associated protein Csm5